MANGKFQVRVPSATAGSDIWNLTEPELEPEASVVLLKWDYFSAAAVEYEPEVPASHLAAGFRP
jgi:hypothetical protein